jgi:hypothetical protein
MIESCDRPQNYPAGIRHGLMSHASEIGDVGAGTESTDKLS